MVEVCLSHRIGTVNLWPVNPTISSVKDTILRFEKKRRKGGRRTRGEGQDEDTLKQNRTTMHKFKKK
jgi:hypothetical protein